MDKFLIILLSTLVFATSYDKALSDLKSKQYESALSIVNELVQSDNADDKVFYLASQIYYAIGDLDNANSNILNAIKDKGDNEEYREYQKQLEKLKSGLKSARKTFDNGYVDDSINEYNLLKTEFSDSSIPYYSLGQVYLKTNNYSMAVENFKQAISINSYEREKYSKSIASISQRLAKSGDEKFRVKEFEEALLLYLEAVDYNPSFVAVLYRITNVYQKMRDYNNARIFAEKTLQQDPYHYKAMKTLGDLSYKSGDIDKSVEFYNRSINANSQYYILSFLILLDTY